MTAVSFRWLLCLWIAGWAVARPEVAGKSDVEVEDENVLFERYVRLDESLRRWVNSGVKVLLPHVLELSERLNVSSTCSRDVFGFLSDVRKLKLSAIRLVDASAKVSAGMLSGNVLEFGDYDECRATPNARYCMLNVRPRLPRTREKKLSVARGIQALLRATRNTSELMQFLASNLHYAYRYDAKFGVCVPSGCTSRDVDAVAKYIGEKAPVDANVAYCDGNEKAPTASAGRIVATFFFSLFGALTLLGSALDYYSRRRGVAFQSLWARLLLCFSIVTNFPKIVSTRTSDPSLTSVFGIRSLSVFYIVLVHQYFFLEKFVVLAHMLRFTDSIQTLILQIIINGLLTTEVFIFLGGFLHAYSVLKYMENGKRNISYISMIVHRLLRIYPAYLFVLMSIYILNDVEGPLGPSVRQKYLENCDKYWWYNLVFINNFFNQQDMCLFHGWYIAADMHLFLISLSTIPLLAKNPKRGVSVHLGLLAAGLLSSSLWAWHKEISPALVPYHVDSEEINRFSNAYTSTFPHIAPYFAGVLFGYVTSVYKDIKIPWACRALGWPLSGVAFTSMLFLTLRWNSGTEPSVMGSVLYFSLSRLVYVTAVGWILFCCASGSGGVVNYILSLKVWVPVSRVSYMMFLVSPVLQILYISKLRMVVDSDDINYIWRHFGDLVASFLLALVMATIIESPFVALEKIIFRRPERTKDVEKDGQDPVDRKVRTAMELENNCKNTMLDLQSKE